MKSITALFIALGISAFAQTRPLPHYPSNMSCAITPNEFSVMGFDGQNNTYTTEIDMTVSSCDAGTDIAAAYTGRDFVVFDGTRRWFTSTFANMTSPAAKLSAGENVAILYDGDDIHVYSRATGMFWREFSESASAYSAAIAGRDNAAAYDGQYAYFFCGSTNTSTRKWVSNVRFPSPAFPYLSPDGSEVGFFVSSRLVRMRSTCDVEAIYASPR